MVKSEFKILKPDNWNTLKFCQKIKYYSTQLNRHFSPYVDKLVVKNMICDITQGRLKTAPIRKIMRSYDDLTVSDILANCIIKTSHASGWNVPILRDEDRNIKNIIGILSIFDRKFLIHNELQYSFLEPRFYIEELIEDKYKGKDGKAIVYMIRCIYGQPITVSYKYGNKQNTYNTSWKLLMEPELEEYPEPKNLKLMLETARILSDPFEFVRIDFHIDVNDDIYFSEFTFTPNAGGQVFTDELEYSLGSSWI